MEDLTLSSKFHKSNLKLIFVTFQFILNYFSGLLFGFERSSLSKCPEEKKANLFNLNSHINSPQPFPGINFHESLGNKCPITPDKIGT